MKMKNVKHNKKVPDNTCFVLNIDSVGPWNNFQEMLYRTTKLNLVNKRNDSFLSGALHTDFILS